MKRHFVFDYLVPEGMENSDQLHWSGERIDEFNDGIIEECSYGEGETCSKGGAWPEGDEED